ncbi:hypothetical protein KA005_31240 [bacterium]|nr:hypothetical protein [bacterium]
MRRPKNNAIFSIVIGALILIASFNAPTFELSGKQFTPDESWSLGLIPSWIISGFVLILGGFGVLLSKSWGRWALLSSPVLLIIPAIIVALILPEITLGYEVLISVFLLIIWLFDIHKIHFSVINE